MKTIVIILSVLLLSCNRNSAPQNTQGLYVGEGEDFKYSLTLNGDSTFSFEKKYFEVLSSCSGKWKRINNDTIVINCVESQLSEKLQGGYMSEREKKIIVLNDKRLKIDSVILERTQ